VSAALARLPAAPLGWAVAGAAAVAAALAAPLPALHPTAAGRVLLAAAAAGLAVAVGLGPHGESRLRLGALALAGLGAQALLAGLADPLALAVLLVVVGFAVAAVSGTRPYPVRLRGPAMAAFLLGLGWALTRQFHVHWMGRVGGLGLALGLAAAGGLFPYLQDLDPEEPTSASSLVWTALLAPALALGVAPRVLSHLSADEARIFGGTLVALGLLNLAWGVVGAWRTATDAAAWRYSFLATWGLALAGFGLVEPDGRAAAELALVGIVAVQLPLWIWARPVLRGLRPPTMGPLNGAVAAVLAGAPPFAGFPVRLLLLRGSTEVSWQLAGLLALGMLAWAVAAPRLARSLGHPRGAAALGLGAVLGIALVLGLVPSLPQLAGLH
jgi:hypothetical protein